MLGKESRGTYYIQTFGCQMNERDSETNKVKTVNKYAKYAIIGLAVIFVLISGLVYKKYSLLLLIFYIVLGLLISLFNYVFKANIIYIYLILLLPPKLFFLT